MGIGFGVCSSAAQRRYGLTERASAEVCRSSCTRRAGREGRRMCTTQRWRTWRKVSGRATRPWSAPPTRCSPSCRQTRWVLVNPHGRSSCPQTFTCRIRCGAARHGHTSTSDAACSRTASVSLSRQSLEFRWRCVPTVCSQQACPQRLVPIALHNLNSRPGHQHHENYTLHMRGCR